MTNSHTHQRGKGLFISRKSPSQTCPVVLSLVTMPFDLPTTMSSSRQTKIPTTVIPAMYIDQKLFVKSLIILFL